VRRDWLLSGRPLTPTRPVVPRAQDGHSHAHQWSRRGFLQTAAGAAAFGAAAGAGLFRPSTAQAGGPGIGLAEPIPTTLEFFPGVQSHVLVPPTLLGPDSDPSTVYNFRGTSAIAFISGMCEQRNRRTGATRTLPFTFNDMRFMKGVFRGRDGHERRATFALV
jgi:hypothetical protein